MHDLYFIEIIQAIHEDWPYEQCQDWYYENSEYLKECVQLFTENLIIRKLS